MRSRYTAYVKRDGTYLHRTWAQSSRPPKAQLMRLAPTNWTRLTIVRTEAGDINDSIGIVEFIATWQENNQEQSLHEISHFTREKGRWVYLNGDIQTT
jgi:SEC-C motif-containing protein